MAVAEAKLRQDGGKIRQARWRAERRRGRKSQKTASIGGHLSRKMGPEDHRCTVEISRCGEAGRHHQSRAGEREVLFDLALVLYQKSIEKSCECFSRHSRENGNPKLF